MARRCAVPYVPIEVAATGPKVIDAAARCADQICFAVGADVSRLGKCMARARRSAQAAGRDPNRLRFGAFINCVVHPDPEVAREAIRGGLSTFARFSGVKGMSVEAAGTSTRRSSTNSASLARLATRPRVSWSFAISGSTSSGSCLVRATWILLWSFNRCRPSRERSHRWCRTFAEHTALNGTPIALASARTHKMEGASPAAESR